MNMFDTANIRWPQNLLTTQILQLFRYNTLLVLHDIKKLHLFVGVIYSKNCLRKHLSFILYGALYAAKI